MSEANPLSSLTPEQLERLYKILCTSNVKQPFVNPHEYWLIRDGYFETTMSKSEAPSAEIAFKKAQDSLQPWYFVGHDGELAGQVTSMTHNEWVDWVRS